MTTNSPNPVGGDVQAHQMPELTQRARQAVIEFCIARIAHLERCIKAYPGHPAIKVDLLVQQVALAALTAEPVAYTDAEELETLRNGTFADMFTPHESYKADQLWIPLYTTPPAQLLRPVELPQSFYGVVQDGKSVMLAADDGQWLNKTAVTEALRQQGYEVKK